MKPMAALAAAATVAMLAMQPAAAQDAPRDDETAAREMRDMAERLDDPRTQQRASRAIAAITRALLSMPLAPIAEAAREIDPSSDLADMPDDANLGDLAGPNAEQLPQELAARTGGMMRATSVMATRLAVLTPVLRDMAREMRVQMERELRNAR